MSDLSSKGVCVGCGAVLERIDGPTHTYMSSSPAYFSLFTKVLACEYSDRTLLPTHRLTVDTYAVQHPATGRLRKEIQSVGLHLARLMLQLDNPLPPKETNDVMLGLGRHKASLIFLQPPTSFTMTVANVAKFAGEPEHADRVREWADSTWKDWPQHHDYIRHWVAKSMAT
ncbi:DUF5946 family protein [Yoonia sp. R2-816]|uniref:DUF5946 family protein n=1 Tax=Yoonia sp. R2-816 TaxID=3342638 RepID=UPI0037284E08